MKKKQCLKGETGVGSLLEQREELCYPNGKLKEGTLNIIKVALENDGGLPAEEQKRILSYCRKPQDVPEQTKGLSGCLSLKSVAERLDVSLRTVQRWVSTGNLKTVLIGGLRRVSMDEVEQFVKDNTK